MRIHLQIECNEIDVDDCKVIPSVQICGHAKHPQIERSEICGNSSIGRATAFQAVGCGFETRFPLKKTRLVSLCSSVVEHFLGKEEVVSSILTVGSD